MSKVEYKYECVRSGEGCKVLDNGCIVVWSHSEGGDKIETILPPDVSFDIYHAIAEIRSRGSSAR